METFTAVTHNYLTSFAHFSSLFLNWGQMIFWSLLCINFAWMCLWYAFDKQCLTQSLSAFLKRFVGILIFYTLMLHPNWLFSLLETVHVMGKTLTGLPLDPSSVISMGITLGNKTIMPLAKSSLLTIGYSAIIILIVYLVIIFTFLTIALELALTLITTTALISISALFLSFSALNATALLARNILDVILGNCFRLLGIYLVVGVGSHTIQSITSTIPVELISFDQYVWVVASCLLFWLLAKNLPNQLAKIASISVQDHHGTDSSALAMSAIRTLSQATSQGTRLATKALALTGVPQAAKLAASTVYSAAMQMAKSRKEGASVLGSAVKGSMNSAFDVAKATGQTASEHFKQTLSKGVGGKGVANSHRHIPGISERLFTQAEMARVQASYSNEGHSPSTPTPSPFSANHEGAFEAENRIDSEKTKAKQQTHSPSINSSVQKQHECDLSHPIEKKTKPTQSAEHFPESKSLNENEAEEEPSPHFSHIHETASWNTPNKEEGSE